MSTGWLHRWREEHPEHGVELVSGRIGDYDPPSPYWALSLWLDWTRFGLGFDVEREYGSPSWPDRLHTSVSLGPLTFGAVRTWNERVETRRTPPAEDQP